MSPAAAEIRSSIRTVLASWAGLVADERRLQPPPRDISALARFLVRHVEWLTRHPAAGELVDEIRDLTRAARSIAYPNSIRRFHIGYCPEGDCAGELVALIRPHGELPPSEIVCTISPGHSWPVTWWTRLARPDTTKQPRKKDWNREIPVAGLTADDIATVWRIPKGTVYRYAHKYRWRRYTEAGRAYYHTDDVTATFDGSSTLSRQ